MISVALIGGDGSGKSTLATALTNDAEVPMTYLYMGANIESSNVALPWSRLATTVKVRQFRKEASREGIADPTYATTHHMRHRQQSTSLVRTVLRLTNRLTEVAYRNVVAARMKRRGHHVVFDRHFLFDSFVREGPFWSLCAVDKANRLYRWALLHLFPLPDLVLFLDADPEVMTARKAEATVDYLRDRNDYWRRLGSTLPNFLPLDANQSPDEVLFDARAAIKQFLDSGTVGLAGSSKGSSQ